MIRNVLLIATICSFASGALLPEQAVAMLPVGNDAHRHFYKEQEWIWEGPEHPAASSEPDTGRDSAPVVVVHPAPPGAASSTPVARPQAVSGFTLLTSQPEPGLA